MAQDFINKYMVKKKSLLSVWESDIALGLGVPGAALAFQKGENHAVCSPTVRRCWRGSGSPESLLWRWFREGFPEEVPVGLRDEG